MPLAIRPRSSYRGGSPVVHRSTSRPRTSTSSPTIVELAGVPTCIPSGRVPGHGRALAGRRCSRATMPSGRREPPIAARARPERRGRSDSAAGSRASSRASATVTGSTSATPWSRPRDRRLRGDASGRALRPRARPLRAREPRRGRPGSAARRRRQPNASARSPTSSSTAPGSRAATPSPRAAHYCR